MKRMKLSQKRVDRIIEWVGSFANYEEMKLAVDDITSRLRFGVSSEFFESAMHEGARIIGFESERPDKEWKEGPDNLWLVRDGEYFVFECKSETQADRVEISKADCGQMNTAVVWFRNNYPNTVADFGLIHPSRKPADAGGLAEDVKIVTKKGLAKLISSMHAFYKELRNLDLHDLDPEAIQNYLDHAGLSIDLLREGLFERPKR